MGDEEKSLEGKQSEEESKDDAKGAEEGGKPDPKPEDKAKDDDVKDKHGQPGINKERHEKEMAEKDAEIAKLKAEVAKAAETKEGREKLEKRIEELEKSQAEERVTHKLELAGCRSIKAAKVLLDDYDGDVSKLKAEHPYLFEEKRGGSTGRKPAGAASGPAKTIREALKG